MIERHAKVVRCIRRLLKGRDFGLFQETWLGRHEANALAQDFPSWIIYYNNMDRNRGGIITMVRKTVAKLYNITRVDLPAAAAGRILVLRFKSIELPNDARAHFNLVNVYLSSGQDMDDKLAEINCLGAVDASSHTFAGGDFNFVEKEADCTGPVPWQATACRGRRGKPGTGSARGSV